MTKGISFVHFIKNEKNTSYNHKSVEGEVIVNFIKPNSALKRSLINNCTVIALC